MTYLPDILEIIYSEMLTVVYIYGLCTMFYGMMAWLFGRKSDNLSRLVALLMGVICISCVKDLFFLQNDVYENKFDWSFMTAIDMVAIPIYAFILMELVKPGKVTKKLMITHEIPFVVLPLLLIVTQQEIFYYILVAFAAVYGTYYLIWTMVLIPRYNRQLKERFSYTENINLNWLRVILYSFYLILALWIVDCTIVHLGIECTYMVGALVIWMIIDYFIYKHESVLDELSDNIGAEMQEYPINLESGLSEIGERITALFNKEKIYLNPHLKLSDIAVEIGTNRTYVSTFFNKEAGCTFYDYVNGFRIEHACNLLNNSTESIRSIAEHSGFNSPQSFIRVFYKIKGVSPSEYRSAND